MQSEQQLEQELERAHEIAWAKLGVAEDVGWIAACFAAIAAYLAWSSWIVGIVVLGGGFYAITLSYRSELERAKETYYRAAKLGEYSGRWGPKTPEDDSE